MRAMLMLGQSCPFEPCPVHIKPVCRSMQGCCLLANFLFGNGQSVCTLPTIRDSWDWHTSLCTWSHIQRICHLHECASCRVLTQRAGQCRLSRRRFKLAKSEESDNRSGSDPDSGSDEALKTKKRKLQTNCFGEIIAGSDDCSDADSEDPW